VKITRQRNNTQYNTTTQNKTLKIDESFVNKSTRQHTNTI
jgi:hypothetical protein